MPEEITTDTELFELSDMEVLTVGMVGKGANDQTFFLLKHDKESSMPDELTIEELDETPQEVQDEALSKSDQGLIKQFVNFIKGQVAKANPVALAQAARILTAGGYPVTAAKLASLLGGGSDEDDDEETSGKPYKAKAEKEVAKSDTEETTAQGGTDTVSEATETVVSKAIEDRLAEIQKANDAWKEAVEKALEEKHKGEIEVLKAQADEAKTEVAKAIEAREEREWIEKASEMTFALGASQKELGQHLHVIAKTAPAETVDYIVAVLKAADHTLTESNLFSEFGTSQVAEEVEVLAKAEKIAKEKGISLAEALLELTPAEQAEMTKGFNQGGKN